MAKKTTEEAIRAAFKVFQHHVDAARQEPVAPTTLQDFPGSVMVHVTVPLVVQLGHHEKDC